MFHIPFRATMVAGIDPCNGFLFVAVKTMNRLSAIAVAVALLTGLVVGELHALVTAPLPIAANSEPRAAQIAGTFYQGMNQLLEDGDPALLQTTLHPAYTDHALPSSPAATADDLETWLADLARSSPGIQIRATSTTIRNGFVASTLVLESRLPDSGSRLTLLFDASSTMHDLLRIENGRVVERWSAPPADRLGWMTPVGQADFVSTLDGREIALERIALPHHARLEVQNLYGAILLSESGSAETGLRSSQDSSPATPNTQSPDMSRLLPGETRTIPAAQPFWVGNSQREPAVLIMLSLRATHPIVQRSSDPFALVAGGMVSRELLSFGPAFSGIGEHLDVEINRIHLEAGATIAAHVVEEAELVLAIDGRVEVIVDAGVIGVLTAAGTISQRATTEVLQPGEALMAYADSEVSYLPAGESSSTMMVITITSGH
jgi:hypothetical protein